MSCGCGGGCCKSKKCPCHIVDCEGIPLAGDGTECSPYELPCPEGDPTRVYDNGDTTYTVIHGDGSPPVIIKTCECGDAGAETVTTLTHDAVGQSFTYTSEDGTVTNVPYCCPDTVTTFVFDPVAGTITYTSEDGTTTVVPLGGSETVTTLTHDPVGQTFTYTSEDGTITTIPYCCPDVVTTFTHDPVAQSITYVSEDGTVTTVTYGDVVTTLTHDAVAQEFTYTSEDGTITTVPYCCPDTVTTLAYDPVAMTFTYTNENGDIVTVPLGGGGSETVTTLIDNGDGTYNYTNESGVVTVINVNEIDMDVNSVTITGSVMTFTSEDGTVVNADICAIIGANCNSTLTVNPDNSLTHVANDGTVTNVPGPGAETVTSLTLGATCGTLTYTDEAGTANTITLPGLLSGIVVTDNPDGTAVLTDGCSTAITIPVSAPAVANGGAAPPAPPDPQAPSISYDETTGNITHVWDVAGQVWVPAPSGCCDVIWDETSGTTPPLPPSNTQAPAEAYDETTGNITHVWNVTTQAWVPSPAGCCVFSGADGSDPAVTTGDPGTDNAVYYTINPDPAGDGSAPACFDLTHVWDDANSAWVAACPADGCCDVEWDSSGGGLPPNPPPNPASPAEAYDPATGVQTHVWDTANQVWVPSPSCCDETAVGPPTAPAVDPDGEPWGYYEQTDIGGNTYIIQEYVQDPVTGQSIPVMCCARTSVIYCGAADAATPAPALGEIVPSVFCTGDGIIEEACLTGLDNGLDGTVIVELVVNGAATGQTITINPVGAGAPIAECVDLTDIPVPAGPSTVSWFVQGGTATTGWPTGVSVDFIGHCA